MKFKNPLNLLLGRNKSGMFHKKPMEHGIAIFVTIDIFN